jgi:hypothetical protein
MNHGSWQVSRVMAAAGALGMIAALFLPWYSGGDQSGFEALIRLDVLTVIVAALIAGLVLVDRTPELQLVLPVAGSLAAFVAGVFLAEPIALGNLTRTTGPLGGLEHGFGYYLEIGSTLLVIAAGVLATVDLLRHQGQAGGGGDGSDR